jgi:integrase
LKSLRARADLRDRGRIRGAGEGKRPASEGQLQRDLPPLSNATPHTPRRTYISSALVASNFDVKWVMAQVGHADSRMPMDV